MSHTDAQSWGGQIVWRPTPELIAGSNLKRLMDRCGIGSLAELQRRSTDDIAWFWDTVLRTELHLEFYRPYDRVVDLSDGIAWPRWCVGGVMNIVHNCLDRYAGKPIDAKPAIRWESEDGRTRTMSYHELRLDVNRMAAALRGLGLGKGDAVGLFMPMTTEIVVALLAVVKIGGIVLPLFSGFGAAAIASRLNDAGAVALFTADGCHRRGKTVAMLPVAAEAAGLVHTLRHLIVLRHCGLPIADGGSPAGSAARTASSEDPSTAARSARRTPRSSQAPSDVQPNPQSGIRNPKSPTHDWHTLLAAAPDESPTEPTGADDPMMILYTSGTTGRPKGAVHTHCGFPVKAAQDILHGLDLHADETLYWMTDMGWMMGPWLVFGTLLLGATMVLYDGAPDYPDAGRVWGIVERHGVTALGISPTLVRALLPHGEQPVRRHDLSSLRKFGSTGEPWNPEPWRWLFEVVGGGRRPIINYSGGTEISGGIVMGNVLTPMKPTAFAGPLPGMDADVVDEHGHNVRGQVGELVIRKPWIGMTRGFWRDRQRYLDTYWSRFEGVWVHGDWAAIDEDGLWYILGRSDDTIKIAGKRLGPAEVESILVAHPAVKEAAAIGVPDELKGQALVCFCVLKAATGQADDALRADLTAAVIRELGKPLAPKEIRFVHDLPKTRNAKVMRRVIRAAYIGNDPGDISSLENPQAIEEVHKAT